MNKTCSLCGKTKPLSDFNKRKTTYDGYHGSCKECRAAYDKQRYDRKRTDILIQKEGYFRENKERIAEKRKTPAAREKHRKVQAAYQRANSAKAKAHNKVMYAITKGKLPKPESCTCQQCGRQATEYHHKSYEPEHRLDVTPLCHSCHMKIHVGVRDD